MFFQSRSGGKVNNTEETRKSIFGKSRGEGRLEWGRSAKSQLKSYATNLIKTGANILTDATIDEGIKGHAKDEKVDLLAEQTTKKSKIKQKKPKKRKNVRSKTSYSGEVYKNASGSGGKQNTVSNNSLSGPKRKKKKKSKPKLTKHKKARTDYSWGESIFD